MSKTEYKNSIQSRRKIASAYLSLLANKNNKFTVTDIVKKIGVNRGTFYLHFKNLDEVASYIEDELADNFKVIEEDFRQNEIDKSPEIILNKFNEIFSKDIEYYRLVINVCEQNTVLVEKIKRYLINTISNNFKVMKYVMDHENFKIVVQYIVGGVVNAYMNWFKGKINCDLSRLSLLLSKMIKDGLKGVIRYGYDYN